MSDSLTEVAWPSARLGEAVEALSRRCRLGGKHRAGPPLAAPATTADEDVGSCIEATANGWGIESVLVESSYSEVADCLRGAAPALLRTHAKAGPGFLALLGHRRGRLAVLTPDLTVAYLRVEEVRAAVCADVEASVEKDVQHALDGACVPARRRPRARQALLRGLLAGRHVGACWLLRPGPAAGLLTQMREAGLPRLFAILIGAHALESALWLLSWWLLGWMTLENRLEPGWFLAWLLLLGSSIPFRLLAVATGGQFSTCAGALVKRRLLVGALRMEPDEVRQQGVGQLLGRAIETEVIENVAVAGGFLALTASVELGLAALVFIAAGRFALLLLVLAWTTTTALLAWGYYRRRRRWTAARTELTNDLVESMVGHRTRLAQEPAGRRHEAEDATLEHYLGKSAEFDRWAVALQVLVPRGWFLVGLLGLAPAFLTGAPLAAGLAVALGAMVLAYRGFRHLVEGLERLTGAAVAWAQNRPFWEAARRRQSTGHAAGAAILQPPPAKGQTLIDARQLVYRYGEGGMTVLAGVDLCIRAGERVLLLGASGGGKSTLAALLAGCREPTSGLLLFRGLDGATLGAEGWRRRVVLAPQFHDNHVLMGPLAFNILMGRRWPPSQADLEEAERVCRALGLGPLLDRMPAGLQQLVGETGWQLSHGEKSRLYIARAVLQGADIVILDESFGALDPETLRRALSFVLDVTPTVVVIAHP